MEIRAMSDGEKDLQCLHFFLQIAATAPRPIPKLTLFKMFRERSNHGLSDTHLYYRIPKMIRILENNPVYTSEQKARFLFITSTPVTPELLLQMKIDSVVSLNAEHQLVKFASRNGSVTFQGTHKKPWHVKQTGKGGLKKPVVVRKPESQENPVNGNLISHHVVGQLEQEFSDDDVEEIPVEIFENLHHEQEKHPEEHLVLQQPERPATPPKNASPLEIKPELLSNHNELLNNAPAIQPTLFENPNITQAVKQSSEHPQWNPHAVSFSPGFQPQLIMGPGFTAHYNPQNLVMPNNFLGQFQEPGPSSTGRPKREDSSSTICTTIVQTPPAINFFAQILKAIHHFLFEVLESSLPNLGKLAKEAKHDGLGMYMTPESIKSYTIVYVNKLFKKRESDESKIESEEYWKLKEVYGEFVEQIHGLDEALREKLLPVVNQRIESCDPNDLIRKVCIMEVFGEMVSELESNVKAESHSPCPQPEII